MRVYDVSMAGTDWKPELPSNEKLQNILESYIRCENITDGIITLMCKLMKLQFFNDGNKRTAMLLANHELIKNGKGIISIAEKYKIDFGSKLIAYYENEDNLEDLKEFIYNNCLDGISY